MDQDIYNNQNEYYLQARRVFDQMGSIPAWDDGNQDISFIFNIFQELADLNYGKAFYPLSKLNYNRRNAGGSQEQANCLADLAFDWCNFNQSLKDADVWCDLGMMYDEGYGTQQNYEEAVKWYRQAAQTGHANAQYRLGLMHASGKGVALDDAEAAKWLLLAAKQRESADV